MVQTSASFRREAEDFDGSISLSEILSALSYALDLTEGAMHGHALRSCLLGMRIAEEAKLTQDQTSGLYFALLLKDIGCSNNASRMCQIIGGDDRAVKAGVKLEDWTKPYHLSALKLLWNNVLPHSNAAAKVARILQIGLTQHKNNREMISLRCGRGASIVKKLGMGAMAAEAVRCLDEHWDGSGYPEGMTGNHIPLLSRISAVAQYLDVFSNGKGRSPEKAIAVLQERSRTWFDPEIVRIAVSLDRQGKLWTHCSYRDPEEDTRQAVLDLDQGTQHKLDPDQVDQICEAFADVVDAKSHFTFRHSMGVADAALGIAETMGLPHERVQLVRRAALLHDIGKLSISNTILDKCTELSDEEWRAVHRHPRITRLILKRVRAFREMAIIAGEHHEKLDGTGYPDRLTAKDLSLESRIIAVADVFGALSEDRPYRAGIRLEDTLAIMWQYTPHQLDGDCMEALMARVSTERDLVIAPTLHVPSPVLEYAYEAVI